MGKGRLLARLALTTCLLAALAACGPTCGGSSAAHSSNGSSSGSTNGTFPQNITFTGSTFSGHVTVAYATCVKTTEAFLGFVQDSKAGSALRFDFNIKASAYHGAGTYGPQDGSSPLLGSVYMAGQETWTAQSGTFTVNSGEKSGSVHMHLGPASSEDISGTWRCG